MKVPNTGPDPVQDRYVEWKDWKEDAFGRADKRHGRYFDWHVARALGGRAPAEVLEIGFGNGEFLGYCRERGCRVWAVELDGQLRERATRAGFDTAADLDALPAGASFDLIALFDVLEHIPADRLIPFSQQLAARLRPEGALLLRVPNGDSPFGRRHQHGDLTHVTSFGEYKLRQLAALCGLKLVALGESPWHAQRFESRTLRCLLRAMARWSINRLFGFAYFHRAVDLDTNLVAVLVPLASPRAALS
jgi:SAM-dependent methyltransferase